MSLFKHLNDVQMSSSKGSFKHLTNYTRWKTKISAPL